jgi:hypothetical protein
VYVNVFFMVVNVFFIECILILELFSLVFSLVCLTRFSMTECVLYNRMYSHSSGCNKPGVSVVYRLRKGDILWNVRV